MTNRYTPPSSEVADIEPERRASWLRTALLVLGCSAGSLALSWFLAPAIASLIPISPGAANAGPPSSFLAVDLALSFLFFLLGCFLAARFSKGHIAVASLGVAAVGWLVYFAEVGGFTGMLKSEFPFWYEFFPSHLLAAVIAIVLAERNES